MRRGGMQRQRGGMRRDEVAEDRGRDAKRATPKASPGEGNLLRGNPWPQSARWGLGR